MRFSGTDRDDDSPGWFRLGSVDVTTPILVVLVWTATLIVWAIEPTSKPITQQLWFTPGDVTSGEVWRLLTWPFSHGIYDRGFDLWDIINAAIFWLFATELERHTGRKPFAVLLASSLVIIPLSAVFWSQLLGEETLFEELDLFALTVVLLYCAEHPKRPFFFGIPAWAIAGIIVALEVVNDVSARDWIRLLSVMLAAFLIALVARKIGLLSDYDRVPDVHLPRRKRKGETSAPGQRRKSSGRSKGATGRGTEAPAAGTPAKRSGPLWGRKEPEGEPAEIVQMPTARRRPEPVDATVDDVSVDDLALDLLLDKIADSGMDSLTDAERASLTELTARRKKRD